ncbi:MAG: hypothetical protein J6S61_05875, partial [Elusimicrobiaceae bacterium]|nr:hypothetical protein [Elusimicrobiaceae bacterium]
FNSEFLFDFTIVGIVDDNSPSIYVNNKYFQNILSLNSSKVEEGGAYFGYGEMSSYSNDENSVYDYELIKDRIKFMAIEHTKTLIKMVEACMNITVNFKINTEIKTKIKFAAGPAKATLAMSSLMLFRLYGFTGTGFAHPKIGKPDVIQKSGTIIEPTRSICFNGLKVRRPKT